MGKVLENFKYKSLKKVGYPNYNITDCGKVFNEKGKQLNPDLSNGYKRIWLCNFGKRERFFIHVLVALHFKRVPKQLNNEGTIVVNHIDHDKMNNHVKNLEWVTQSENITKYFIHKRKKQRRGLLK